MKKMTFAFGLTALSLSTFSACSGDPEWVAVYEQCKQTVTDSNIGSMYQAQPDEDSNSRAMRESMNKMALGMAMNACEMIKSTCENDPDSATCQAYLKQDQ